jgi:hypothetical protein
MLMKINKLKLLTAALFAAFTLTSTSAADKVEAGPRGGRLLQTDAPRPEFFVEKDRTVSIAFYDANKKKVPAAAQVVTAVAEAKSGKAKLEFEKKGDLLVSKSPLPEGNGYTVVVQYRANAEAKPQNFRIPLNTETCGGCKFAEYACTCDE